MTALAWLCVVYMGCVFVQDLPVVSGDYLLHVRGGGIGNFDFLPIHDRVEGVVFRKMFCNEL